MGTSERMQPMFAFDLNFWAAAPPVWIMLGECQAKFEQIVATPLRPDVARQISLNYMVKGVQASVAMDGSSITEEQVALLLEGKEKQVSLPINLQTGAKNVAQACAKTIEMIVSGKTPGLNYRRILELNNLAMQDLDLDQKAKPGKIRPADAAKRRLSNVPAEDCEFLIKRLCEWLGGNDFVAQPGFEMAYAVLKAVVAHFYLSWIRPFGDGNGRTARLLEFQILVSSGVPAVAAHVLSRHYYQTRAEYGSLIDVPSLSSRHLISFITYAVKGYREGLKLLLGRFREKQGDVIWRDYINDLFQDRQGRTVERLQILALDMSSQKASVPLAMIQEVSPRVARAYAGKTRKTVLRDLGELEKLELIEKTPEGYRARRELLVSCLR